MNIEKTLLAGILFALALRVSSVLHEGAHALVAWLYGVPITVSNFTVHGKASPPVAIAMAAAGPLYSLVQGVACALALQSLGAKNSVLRLLLVWLSLHGLSAAFGYLLTPFGRAGDVALICRLLAVGNAVRGVLVLLGAAGILWTGWWCAALLLPFAEPGALLDAPEARARLLLELAVVPWLAGTVIAFAFAWPFANRFSLLYEVTSGAFTIAAYRFAQRASVPELTHGWPEAPIWPWALVTAVVMLASRLTIGRPE
jgi:hypothetical protein